MGFFTPEQADTLYLINRSDPLFEDMVGFLSGPFDEFVKSEVAPKAYVNDRDEIFDEANFRALGELGFMAIPYPEEFGGMNACFSYFNAGLETLAKADAGFALGVAIHGTMSDGIRTFGSEALKERFLPDLISGQRIGAFALSEANSGSDAKAMKTSYRFDADTNEYVLNGTKYWITNAMSAEVFFVMARGQDGRVSSFVVEKGGKGTFSQAKIEDKMGVRGSNTAELVFEEYRIPKENLVGEEGRGFNYAMHMLNGGRVTIASWSTGVGQGAYEKLMTYAHERELFGGQLKDLPIIQYEISQMAIDLNAARHMSYSAAFTKSQGRPLPKIAAMAKVFASETAVKVSERAIELSGGYGYVQDSRIERHLRDALLARIGEGANEVLRGVVIPRILLKEFAKRGPSPLW